MIYIISFLLLISIYININLYFKLDSAEKTINDGLTLEEDYLRYYEAILYLLISAKSDIDAIDKRGSFSSDDEVGFAFKVIQTSIDNIINKMKELSGKEE